MQKRRNHCSTTPRSLSPSSLERPLPAKLNAGTDATEGRTSLVGMKVVLPPSRQKRPRGRTKRPPGGGASVTEREPRKCKVARTTDEHRDQPAADADDEPLNLPVGAVSIMIHSLCDSPEDIRSLSLVSKDIRASCTESMESVCRRRWQDKSEFQRRCDSALADKISTHAGPSFWYHRYFEEERKVRKPTISGDNLKRLSWTLENSAHPLKQEYVLNFNGEAPRFAKNTRIIVRAIDQGRTEGSLEFLTGGPHSRRAGYRSTNWFLEVDHNGGGTVLCLGTPNGICHPCVKFALTISSDTWQYVLQSDRYLFKSHS